MERTMGKTVAALLLTMLVASSMLILLARALTEYETTTTLSVVPNPVGVGQQVLGTGVVSADVNPPGGIFQNLEVTIVRPDGSVDTIGPFNTDAEGVYYFTYAPTQIGTWHFEVYYPGYPIYEVYEGGDWWMPSTADCDIFVQEAPVSEIPVLPGQDVTVHPDPTDPRVSLTFEEITSPGTITMTKTPEPPEGVPPLPGIIGLYYDFEVTFSFTGIVEVGLPYDDTGLSKPEGKLRLWHYEGPLVGDVNHDGKVNAQDIWTVAKSIPSKPGDRRWNPACDLNGDGQVNVKDLLIVIKNRGRTSWKDITIGIDTANNVIYGATGLFSIFGVR